MIKKLKNVLGTSFLKSSFVGFLKIVSVEREISFSGRIIP
jgi:hypothetical protein